MAIYSNNGVNLAQPFIIGTPLSESLVTSGSNNAFDQAGHWTLPDYFTQSGDPLPDKDWKAFAKEQLDQAMSGLGGGDNHTAEERDKVFKQTILDPQYTKPYYQAFANSLTSKDGSGKAFVEMWKNLYKDKPGLIDQGKIFDTAQTDEEHYRTFHQTRLDTLNVILETWRNLHVDKQEDLLAEKGRALKALLQGQRQAWQEIPGLPAGIKEPPLYHELKQIVKLANQAGSLVISENGTEINIDETNFEQYLYHPDLIAKIQPYIDSQRDAIAKLLSAPAHHKKPSEQPNVVTQGLGFLRYNPLLYIPALVAGARMLKDQAINPFMNAKKAGAGVKEAWERVKGAKGIKDRSMACLKVIRNMGTAVRTFSLGTGLYGAIATLGTSLLIAAGVELAFGVAEAMSTDEPESYAGRLVASVFKHLPGLAPSVFGENLATA